MKFQLVTLASLSYANAGARTKENFADAKVSPG